MMLNTVIVASRYAREILLHDREMLWRQFSRHNRYGAFCGHGWLRFYDDCFWIGFANNAILDTCRDTESERLDGPYIAELSV